MNEPKSLDEARQMLRDLLPDNREGLISPADLRAALLIVLYLIQEGIDQ